MSKIYLRGLDGLRGIAALLVVLGHVELMKSIFNLTNVYDGGGPFFLYLGNLSVTFFFVLSGFLITFLLLKEREANKKIAIKNFYIRRILRIWPVYYILFFLGFVIVPLITSTFLLLPVTILKENYWEGFILNLVMLPNFTSFNNPIAFQSWSIGVEEQFYIFWPILVSRIRSLKKLAVTMICIFLGIYILRTGVYINNFFDCDLNYLNTINSFFGRSRFDNMSLGGVLAIIYYTTPNYKFKLLSKIFILLCLCFFLIKTNPIGFGLDNPLASVVFCFFLYWIINIKKHFFLENKFLVFLGKISYGIYMYHVIGILIALNFLNLFNFQFDDANLYYNISLYLLSICITIVISHFSYYFMESKILKLKNRL